VATVARRPTKDNDGVTDLWYAPPIVASAAGGSSVVGDNDTQSLYYALGNPRRTTHPLNDRKTTYPDLP
jgi:hypothetical protein